MREKKDFKLYYFIFIIQEYLLNDEKENNNYLNLMKEIINMNQLPNFNIQNNKISESCGLVLVDAKS